MPVAQSASCRTEALHRGGRITRSCCRRNGLLLKEARSRACRVVAMCGGRGVFGWMTAEITRLCCSLQHDLGLVLCKMLRRSQYGVLPRLMRRPRVKGRERGRHRSLAVSFVFQ